MRTRFVAVAVLLIVALGNHASVFAQGSDGTLVGYLRDDTGAVLPGVTVSATSPVLIGTRTVVTDAQGSFRLLNLPPGQYVLTAELAGFSNYRQEGIVMRAGATFTQNIQLKLSTVQETVNVVGASPMLEVGTPTHAVNISGDFQREIPIQARKSYTDFLEMTTGVISRPLDDNSGRMLYIGHGVDSWSYVVQIEGSSAVNYQDAGAQNVSMSNELISDVNVKIAGIPAAEPMGSGLVINIATKSGGDQFSGAASLTYQPLKWNGDNVPEGQSATADSLGRGQPTKQQVQQPDLAFGGPLVRGRAWFFGAYRYQDTETAVGFTTQQVQQFQALVPGWQPFNSTSSGHQPYAKLTAQLNANHQLSGFWQYDRLEGGFHRSIYYEPITIFAQGGSLFGVKLTDAWGTNTTTTFQASYNNKSGADEGTFSRLPGSGPQIDIHQDTFISRGLVTGTGAFGTGGNVQNVGLSPASMLIFRGDLTHHKQGGLGSHDFQTGFFAAPRLHRDNVTMAVNDGFVYQERALIDPTNLAGGTYPFHERFVSPTVSQSIKSRDRDIGVYVQDSWKPNERLTITPGLRVDFVRRFDGIFNVVRMKDTAIAPRFSMTYLATADARNVLRFSAGRVHEQVNGRDFSSSRAAGGGRDQSIDKDRQSRRQPGDRGVDRGGSKGVTRGGVRPEPAPAVHRRDYWGVPEAVWRSRGSRCLARPSPYCGRVPTGGCQWNLSRGPGTALHRLRQSGPDPRYLFSADQQHVVQGRLHGAGGDRQQAVVEPVPVPGRHPSAMAAPDGHVEPNRPGSVHPARRLRERQGLVDDPRQLRSQQLRSARPRQRVRANLEAVHDSDGHDVAGAGRDRRRR